MYSKTGKRYLGALHDDDTTAGDINAESEPKKVRDI